jgi:RNA polymerase sigma factor (sigma-70 family)
MAKGQSEAVLDDLPQGLLDAGTVAGVSDGQLLARFTAHRDGLAEIAFAALVRRHGPMVLRVCQQILGDWHTAEDAFQATFLILARRAGSLRQPELLGHWLYGVALRTAREARMRDDRRRRRESPNAEGLGAEPVSEAGRPELPLVSREEVEALHEELSRLPERYRVPVVLCELEGLTYHEAALRLRCPVGTIGVRLRRARERLRLRLTRRGLAPATGLMAALLGAEATSAWVPPVLVDATVQAATQFAVSKAAAHGLVSPWVIALTEAVLRSMVLTPLKVATSLALAVAITAAVARVGAHPETLVPAAPESAKLQPEVAAPAPLPEDPAAAARAGRPVLNPTAVVPLTISSTLLDALLNANGNGWAETVKARLGKALKPGRDAAPASVVRALRAEAERARGEVFFAKEWVPNDPRSHGGDGLGPVYNETSCVACHGQGAPGGAGPETKNVVLVTATANGQDVSKGRDQIHPGLRGGRSTVLHRYGTDPEYGSWRRRFYDSQRDERPNPPSRSGEDPGAAQIQAVLQQISSGHRMHDRSFRLRPMNGFNLTLSQRNTPALFGVGRIDAISSEVLVAVAAHQPADIRGRIGRTREGRIGRFGWKGQVASLDEFVRGACATELGLEVPGHSQAVSPLAPSAKAKGLDMTAAECDALVAYIRALPAPVAVDPSGPQGTQEMWAGRRLFTDVGCADCHTPTLGDVRGIYSDLLLHDLGESLSDIGSSYGIEGPDSPGGPSPREWRTPPLWGYRDSGPYLHDGRAEDLEEVVALHGGQGQAAARRFFSLSSEDRFRVEAFLKSLVAPSATAAPGVLLAAALESRIEREEQRTPESLVRRRWEEAMARGEWQRREEQQRRRAAEVAQRVQARFAIARALEKKGKITGALEFYTKIAREAPNTEEGRLATARIAALRTARDLAFGSD